MLDTVIRNGLVVDGTGAPPFRADIGLQDGKIVAVGDIPTPARTTIEAAGLVVTPGFVDIHTHYDGQVTWDPYVSPSCLHGVTTVVMGNCGVGFAPVRPTDRQWLIKLMEGVEDIPGTVLSEGIHWEWESFPSYLDALRRKAFAIDVVAQIPHGPLRTYVMGPRGADPSVHPTPEEMQTMAALVREALRLGAAGFSTSRTVVHRTKDGQPVPSLTAQPAELLAIAQALADAGQGIYEVVSDFQPLEDEFALIKDIARTSRRPVSIALTQSPEQPEAWRRILDLIGQARAEGLDIHAQVAARPISVLMGLSNHTMFLLASATYRGMMHLPLADRVHRLAQPATKAAILADLDLASLPSPMLCDWPSLFRFDTRLPYLPDAHTCVAAEATRRGDTPESVAYDWLLEGDGTHFLFLPARNYVDRNPDVLREMMASDHTIIGLADGGAHCAVLSDASMPTFMLTYWRQPPAGPGFSLEWLVHQLTQRTAQTWGLADRGTIAPGQRADLNLIDLDRLSMRMPAYERDLPAGGGRLVQKADGYVMTLVAGTPITVEGRVTGALPGRLRT